MRPDNALHRAAERRARERSYRASTWLQIAGGALAGLVTLLTIWVW